MSFLIQQTLIYAIPLLIVALAGVFAERSGIINLALEGIMIFGAFVGVLFIKIMQDTELFTQDQALKTLPLAMQLISSGASIARAGATGAATFLVIVPTILVYVLTQKHVVDSMAHSGIKA